MQQQAKMIDEIKMKHLQYIPVEYHTQVVCHFNSKHLFDTERVRPDCVVCTSSGFLMEFQNKRLLGCVELANVNAQKIAPFFVYENEAHILYVVQFPDNVLEIIARAPRLKRERLEKNVSEWKIEYSKFGVPQLRVKKHDEAWRSLSFGQQLGAGLSAGMQDMGIPLQFTLQNMQWKLEKYQALLAEKQKVRTRVATAVCEEQRTSSAVNVSACEYVLHHSNLVIAVKIQHMGREPVSDIHLVVTAAHTVKLRQCGREKLAHGEEAYILGSVTCPDLTISAMHADVVYEMCGSCHSISLPPHSITPQSILSKQFQVQHLQEPLCEVLLHCSQVAHVLRLQSTSQLHALAWRLLNSALTDVFSLVRESRDNVVWTSSDAQLGGSYVIVDTAKHTLTICCRDSAQFNMLLLVLQGHIPEDCKLVPCEDKVPQTNSSTSSTAALRHELQWISQHSRFSLAPVTVQQYQAFYQELAKRSCVTDASFNFK